MRKIIMITMRVIENNLMVHLVSWFLGVVVRFSAFAGISPEPGPWGQTWSLTLQPLVNQIMPVI